MNIIIIIYTHKLDFITDIFRLVIVLVEEEQSLYHLTLGYKNLDEPGAIFKYKFCCFFYCRI